jgi:hypothetical protein
MPKYGDLTENKTKQNMTCQGHGIFGHGHENVCSLYMQTDRQENIHCDWNTS